MGDKDAAFRVSKLQLVGVAQAGAAGFDDGREIDGRFQPPRQSANRLTMRDTFWPPNPKLFERARSTRFSRARFGM